MKCDINSKNKNFNGTINVMLNNLLISILVLHDDFGFGKERLDRYIDCVQKKVIEVDKMCADDVYEAKRGDYIAEYRERMREILKTTTKAYIPEILYQEVFETPLPSASEFNRNWKQKKKHLAEKTAVSVSEAVKMQEAAQIFQSFLKEVHEGTVELSIKKDSTTAMELSEK